ERVPGRTGFARWADQARRRLFDAPVVVGSDRERADGLDPARRIGNRQAFLRNRAASRLAAARRPVRTDDGRRNPETRGPVGDRNALEGSQRVGLLREATARRDAWTTGQRGRGRGTRCGRLSRDLRNEREEGR